MITEDKITEIFCMADDFCKFFDAMTAKYALKPTTLRSSLNKHHFLWFFILPHWFGWGIS